MVIACLISGRLFGTPVERTSKAGRRFATGKLRVAVADGESVFVSLVAFSGHVVTALLALTDGDSVALAGELKATAFTDKDGAARPSLDLVAHQVLTAYAVGKKRKAVSQRDSALRPDDEPPQLDLAGAHAPDVAESSATKEHEFDDEIPF